MTLDQALAIAERAMPVAIAFLVLLSLVLPPLGRFVSTWKPRAGEAMIRFGTDLKGVAETFKLPKGTPSVSAPPIESVVVVEPVSKPKEAPHVPPMPLLFVIAIAVGAVGLALSVTGCSGAIPKLEELADDTAEGLTAGAELSNVCTEAVEERKDLRTGKVAPCAPSDAECLAAAEAESHEADAPIASLRRLFCKYAPEGVCS